MIDFDTERQITTTLHEYCTAFDSARFDAFAELFDEGRWFMVDEPGSAPVIDWIHDHVVLYDGSPLTRHEISNVIIGPGDRDDEASFRCYVAIWQHLIGDGPRLLAHARFRGTFLRRDGRWRWREHVMEGDYAGDLSSHIRGGLSVAATG